MSNNSSGGVKFYQLLGVAFIVLKLTHVIDWSWWVVLSPFWGMALIWLAAVIFISWTDSWDNRFNRH